MPELRAGRFAAVAAVVTGHSFPAATGKIDAVRGHASITLKSEADSGARFGSGGLRGVSMTYVGSVGKVGRWE